MDRWLVKVKNNKRTHSDSTDEVKSIPPFEPPTKKRRINPVITTPTSTQSNQSTHSTGLTPMVGNINVRTPLTQTTTSMNSFNTNNNNNNNNNKNATNNPRGFRDMSLFDHLSCKTVRHGSKPTLTTEEKKFNTLMRESKEFTKQKKYLLALKKSIAAKQYVGAKPSWQKQQAKKDLMNTINAIQDKCWHHKLDLKDEALEPIKNSKWYRNIVTDHYHIKRNDENNRNDYILPDKIYNKLYDYQYDCLEWFWQIFQSPNGGILGDDMGLGKTVQMCSFLNGLFFSSLIHCVILIVPVSLISHWTNELKKWCSGPKIREYCASISNDERENNLEYIISKGGILITTYGMIQRNSLQLSKTRKWDYIILDEGHIIKNHLTATSVSVRQISVKNSNKIILSGTFLQNELSELWSLFDFISDGNLFGTYEFFNQSFAIKINNGRLKNATVSEKQLSIKLLNLMKKIIRPYLLSRSKYDIRDTIKLSEKRELVIWIKLSDIQIKLYKSFLKSDMVKQILNESNSALAALNVMKKICDHPFLLSDKIVNNYLELNDKSIKNTLLISSKMCILLQLLKELINNKHRILVFSQSKIILSMIESILNENRIEYLRMDGDTKIGERQRYVDLFNKNINIKIFLLSTKVGGLGLNLTGSDRVIIYDPAWNPAIDAQAIDRSYRIGQINDVMVYRFVTCGTIEEKIYQRQISKVGLLKSLTDDSNQERYFTKDELRKQVLKLNNIEISQTQIQFQKLQHNIGANVKFDTETNYVEQIQNVVGISNHDLLFKK